MFLSTNKYSDQSIIKANEIISFLSNDNVLKANNYHLAKFLQSRLLYSTTINYMSLINYWNNLTTEQKNIISDYANENHNAYLNEINLKVQAFLNDFFTYSLNNPSVTFNDIWFNRIDGLYNYIADNDNNVIGNYDETTYANFQPNQNWSIINPVISPNKFIGWGYGNLNRDCMTYSKEQLRQMGFQISNYGAQNQTFQVYKESTGVNLSELEKGISYLKYALTNNIPVIVGVDLKSGQSPNPQTDNTTDHFIVIVGMGQDNNGKYFRFYDNATGNQELGTHIDNKLYYNSNTNKLTGYSKATRYTGGLPYTVTMIRKSKNL